jgi:hypothetical protein
MKKVALLAAVAGANVFERISRRARVNWKDLIDEVGEYLCAVTLSSKGPLWDSAMMDYQGDEPQQIANSEAFVFDRDDFLNDDPFSNDYFETEEVKPLTLVTGAREDFGEENDVCWESCDAPQECLCKNCCVEKKITCPVDVVVALDVCHCDNSRWIKTIEFVTHLTEEFKERVDDFRLSVVLFNEVSEIAFSLSDWNPAWTLEEIYNKLDNHDLIDFYGRGTFLHTGVEFAMKQFDHDLKRKALLVLYSNGLSQSSDTEVLDVVNNFPGPKIVSVTADALYDDCDGALCPNKQLLNDMTNNMVLDGSGRRQFWAAKQIRMISEESFVCHERACEWCDCDCDFSCENTEALAGIRKEECQNCPMIPCPVDIIFAIDMCHCDPLRMEISKEFIGATADKLIIDSEARGQKVRLSVVQDSLIRSLMR